MVLFVVDGDGKKHELPAVISASVEQTSGSPCDACDVSFVYSEKAKELLRFAREVVCIHGGRAVFTGPVDESEVSLSNAGLSLSLSARGRASLLMDRQVEGAQFTTAQLSDILSRYVRSAGVTEIDAASIPPLAGFTVDGGSTAWRALSDFCGFSADISPRFDGAGRLILRPRGEGGATHEVGAKSPYITAVRNEKRYGILSEVEIVERTSGRKGSVKSEELIALGITGKDVMTSPNGRFYYYLKRAKFRLSESRRDRVIVRLALPGAFAVEPGDRVVLTVPGVDGSYLVKSARTGLSPSGARTDAVLYLP